MNGSVEDRVDQILEIVTRQPSQLWRPLITEVVTERLQHDVEQDDVETLALSADISRDVARRVLSSIWLATHDTQMERKVRTAVRDYCRFAQHLAEEAPDNPHAVGLARAYQDVADKLDEAVSRR